MFRCRCSPGTREHSLRVPLFLVGCEGTPSEPKDSSHRCLEARLMRYHDWYSQLRPAGGRRPQTARGRYTHAETLCHLA